MGECNLDHSLADVQSKLQEQAPYLPKDLHQKLNAFLTANVAQSTLNELFHLLKKYDLADKGERQSRNEKIEMLLARERTAL